MSRKVLIVCALLLLTASMGVAVVSFRTRREGLEALRDVLTRHAAEGYGDSLSDLVSSAPGVDAQRQEHCWEWMRARAKLPSTYSKPLDEAWYLGRASHPPAADREWAERLRPVMQELRQLLDEGPVCLTSLGWVREDAEHLAAARVSGRQLRLAHLMRLREAHRWFAFEAMTTEDPARGLDALDALHVALDSPGSLIDAMLAVACAAMRDRAYARVALRGKLSKERLDAWLAEPARGTTWMADAWRGERLLYWAPLGQALLSGSGLGDHFDDGGGVHAWLHGASDTALFLDFLGSAEGHLRGTVTDDVVRDLAARVDLLGPPFAPALGIRPAMYMMSVRCDAEHRIVRLGVVLSMSSQEHARLPETGLEARTWLGSHSRFMAAGPWSVRLRYERLSPKRYRIVIDPESPVPTILAGTPQADQVLRSPFGEPPHDEVRLRVRQGGFEFEVR